MKPFSGIARSKKHIVWSFHEKTVTPLIKRRFAASSNASTPKSQDGHSVDSAPGERHNNWQAERDLFLSVLSASTTKRDARSYLTRFTPSASGIDVARFDQEFSVETQLHIALVKIRGPQALDDGVVAGIARTLSQLKRLGLISVVVLDCAIPEKQIISQPNRETGVTQADRLVSAIQDANGTRARRIDSVLGVESPPCSRSSTVPVNGTVSVMHGDILFHTIMAGIIPVIPPMAYTRQFQRVADVPPDEIMLALTRQFAGLKSNASIDDSTFSSAEEKMQSDQSLQNSVSVERIILLDPLGPLPSAKRPNKSHIFVNMEQEYIDIKRELEHTEDSVDSHYAPHSRTKFSDLGGGNSSKLIESEAVPSRKFDHRSEQYIAHGAISTANERQIQNLILLRSCLSLLPSSSSALLTSPSEAATFQKPPTSTAADIGVGTRRPRNPLIFNLLTDKPLVSSSLPVSRMQANKQLRHTVQTGRATFVKRGMSLTMIPDPRCEVWEPPRPGQKRLSLKDPRIDFGRLLDLIEDSFGRSLDVEHYMKRVQNRIAGVIVAGQYEGGAILTWELPPGVVDDGSEENRKRMIPYLDKFAVLKRSQGGGGVADMVFSSMVRSCFPNGVCWRSRKDNPVNKWYFERSRGTLKLSDSNWAMFWTTNGLLEDRQKLMDYEAVCRRVEASWADGKKAD